MVRSPGPRSLRAADGRTLSDRTPCPDDSVGSGVSGAGALAQMIEAAARVVVFSGAGISTESGVPDFRSPGGVWSRMKPIYFQDFVTSEAARREAWTRAFTGAAGWT